MAYNNEQGSVSQDLKEGARSAANAAREAKQIAKAAGRAASGDLVGAAAEAAKSKTVQRFIAFSLAFLAFIIFCVGFLIPMTIYEGVTSYAQGVVEEWLTLFYDESGTKPDAGPFVRALSATGGALKKVGLDIADVFKGLWNAIKGTKADDTDTDGATDADLGIMVDTDDLTSVFERKFNATKDKFAGRAKQIANVIEQSSGNDSVLGRAVLSRYNAVANSYIKDSSYDVQYGGYSLSVTPGKLSNKAAVTLMSLESIQHSMNMSKEPLSAYIKWLGYNGSSGKTIEFSLGSNSGITYKIPAWTGGFLPQYLADEEQHYNFRNDFYVPSGIAAESEASSVDFDQYKCSVIDMMIKVTCPDISTLTPIASESTYTVEHTDYREKEVTTYTQVPTYYVKSSLSSKQIRQLTRQGWLTAYARNVITNAQATWLYDPTYWSVTSNFLVRTSAKIPTTATTTTVTEEYTWEETRHMVTLSFRVPVKVTARSVNEIVKLSGMFIGCVFQMSISVLFLKLVLSGMMNMTGAGTGVYDSDGYGPILQLILVLAMCKIAQRTDTYLQQLGIGVPTTGGNLLEDMLGVFHTMGSVASSARGRTQSGGGNGSGAILGAAPSGGRTPIGRALSSFNNSRNSGLGMSESLRNARKAAADNFNKGIGKVAKGATAQTVGTVSAATNLGKAAVARAKGESPEPHLKKAREAGQKVMSGYADTLSGAAYVANTAARPRTQAQREVNQAQREAARKMEAEQNGSAVRTASKDAATATQATRAENRREFATGTSPMPDAVKNAVEKSGPVTNSSQAENNRAHYGVTNKGDAIVPMPKASKDDNSTPGLPTEAKAAGLSIEKDGNYVAGSHPNSVGDWLGHTTSKAAETSYNNGFAGAGTAGHVDSEESYKARAEKLAETYRTPEYAQETKAAREQANQAQEHVASLRSSGASEPSIQAAEASYKNLDQIASQREANMERANRGDTGIDDIKQAIQASDRAAYYASYGEAQANARQAYDAYVTSAASYNELDRMKSELDDSKERYREAKESGVGGSELSEMEADISNQQSAINGRWAEIREAEQHMKDPNFYRNYAAQESESLQKADDKVYSQYADNAVANGSKESPEALREDAVKWSRETADLVANTIERATPYEIDRALSNDSYEYGTTPLTVKMAQREFGAAIPDSASVVAFEATNLKDTKNAEGDVIYGGRQYNIDYKDGDKYGRMTMFDQVFYDGLPAAEKDSYNKYTYADGRVFYFRGGTGDITCTEASKQIDKRRVTSKPAPPAFMNKPK